MSGDTTGSCGASKEDEMSDEQTLIEIPVFEEFPKIPRLSRECVVTEKIDGTNGCVLVMEDGRVIAGSRTRWITPDSDNFGFARWVAEHAEELREGLGTGRHFGEWWGQGIQRRYNQDRKRFSLFNTSKWSDTRPACCDVVPILYSGLFTTDDVARELALLKLGGSVAAPGFMQPEGVVIYHVAARHYFKKTIEKDDAGKGYE
jgi:hypothetical protein